MNPGGCETARFSLYLSRNYFTVHNRHIWGQSALRNAVVLFKAIYLRSDGPKFSDVQVTITEKMCNCGPNSPEITESLHGCYNGTRAKKQSGREFASGPAFVDYLFRLIVAQRYAKRRKTKKFTFSQKNNQKLLHNKKQCLSLHRIQWGFNGCGRFRKHKMR